MWCTRRYKAIQRRYNVGRARMYNGVRGLQAMAQVSTIEQHPQKDKIIEALLTRVPMRTIAARYNLTAQSISRYNRKVILPTIAKQLKQSTSLVDNSGNTDSVAMVARGTRQEIEESPVKTVLARKLGRYAPILQKAEDKEDYRAWASVDGAETRTLELLAKITGELDDRPVSNTLVVIGATPTASSAPVHQAEVIDISPIE